MQNNVVLITGTYYKLTSQTDEVRASLARKTIKKATELGYDIIVIDSGSAPGLFDEYHMFGAKVFSINHQSMGYGRREAVKRGYETNKEVIVWIEPEKEDMLRFIPQIVSPILDNKADFVIPKRVSLASYPQVQQYSEPFANEIVKKVTGQDLDLFFGPRAFNRDQAHYFLHYGGEYGDKWEAIFVPIFRAMKDGQRFGSISVDYHHPEEQTVFEDKETQFYWKRLEQLNNILPALKSEWEK